MKQKQLLVPPVSKTIVTHKDTQEVSKVDPIATNNKNSVTKESPQNIKDVVFLMENTTVISIAEQYGTSYLEPGLHIPSTYFYNNKETSKQCELETTNFSATIVHTVALVPYIPPETIKNIDPIQGAPLKRL
jgi:hypothetical protein